MSIPRTPRTLFALMLLAPVGCGWAKGDGDRQPRPAFALSDDEIRVARQLAEADLGIHPNPSRPLERTYYIKTDLMPDGQVDGSQRVVMVHHYRYEGDEAILTLIDLHALEVLKQERQAHYPTALAAAEVARAEKLAREDGRFQKLLEAGPLGMDARPIQFLRAEDPLFGHRVVHLLLRRGGDYLSTPRVLVDLTTETVHID